MAFMAFFLVSCNAAPAIVRDMNGDILREGANYYIIMPVDHGKAGAVTLSINLKTGVVRESTDLNIEAAGGSYCGKPVWKLDSYGGEFVVSTLGVKGNPGAKTIGNWFKIEKYLNHYKFVYCPSVCKTCKAMCKDIGISRKGKSGRLVLNDKPFMVSFKKF
nr:PREDICTED: miraculin-like [Daucus carota subsp. sativus]